MFQPAEKAPPLSPVNQYVVGCRVHELRRCRPLTFSVAALPRQMLILLRRGVVNVGADVVRWRNMRQTPRSGDARACAATSRYARHHMPSATRVGTPRLCDGSGAMRRATRAPRIWRCLWCARRCAMPWRFYDVMLRAARYCCCCAMRCRQFEMPRFTHIFFLR